MRLRSSDPEDPPIINPNYLSEDIDVKILSEGELGSRPIEIARLYHYLSLPILQVSSGGSGVFIGGGGTGVATLLSGGHTVNTFVLNYRVCNRLYKIINT